MKSNNSRQYENTYANRVLQFEQDEKRATAPVKKKKKYSVHRQPDDNQNPYLRARLKILADYKDWRRKEIEQFEKTGDLTHKNYLSFVKEVTELGDTYAN